ncbi:MAG: hypothetical protein KAQ92_00485 [Candidatus Aenigmarchaeota archaeon]|nr:hypothetical protein [Candidatus Aenigmarchaeota archaeon]MCK5476730.1 hypothetical protein [Candidatus Aenigmarchaeota archaeon]
MSTGLRGFLKDIIIFYLCFKIFMMWIFEAPFTNEIGYAALVLFVIATWFMLERFGFLPRL